MPRAPLLLLLPLLAMLPPCCHDGALLLQREPDIVPVLVDRYVATNGDDDNPGTRAAPWATVRHALTQLSAGSTLYLRNGTYRERSMEIRLRGQPAAPIRIHSPAGETATIDGALPEFDTRPDRAWDLHDAALQIYKSRATFAGAQRVYGALADEEGGHALVPYNDYATLSATSEDYSATQSYYCGPGVFWNPTDACIYVRLQRSRYQDQVDLKVPRLTDARRTKLRLFERGTVLLLKPQSAHVDIQGIRLRGAEYGLELAVGCSDITVRNCAIDAGRYAVLVRGAAQRLVFDHVKVDGHFPAWVPRSDVKKPDGAAPARLLQGAAFLLEGSVQRAEIAHCTMRSCFDGIDTSGAATFINVHDCLFDTIRDDAFEIAASAWNVEFHDNMVRCAAAGVSWNGAQAPPRAHTGKKWIHHNVIDTSTMQLYGRSDPQGLLPVSWRGTQADGMATGRPFGLHDTGGMTDPDPWKIYQNTVIAAADVDGEGFGLAYRFEPFDPTQPHEVLNNVFVQRGEQWMLRFGRVHDGSQIFDGNVWFRAPEAAGTWRWYGIARRDDAKDFADLASFRASAHGRATQVHYTPGFESRGVEADPQLDSQFRPLPAGPAARPGVDLSSRAWPSAQRSGFRGALPPQ